MSIGWMASGPFVYAAVAWMNEQRPSKELMSHWHCPHHGGFDARVAVGCPECVREMREELKRLRTALRGIQSCSTCEACRGAATRALSAEKPYCRMCGGDHWVGAHDRAAQPPGDG